MGAAARAAAGADGDLREGGTAGDELPGNALGIRGVDGGLPPGVHREVGRKSMWLRGDWRERLRTLPERVAGS